MKVFVIKIFEIISELLTPIIQFVSYLKLPDFCSYIFIIFIISIIGIIFILIIDNIIKTILFIFSRLIIKYNKRKFK